MPTKAQALWAMLGQEGEVAASGWPEVPATGSAWRAELGGASLGEIEGLFQKIDDATVEAELGALSADAP